MENYEVKAVCEWYFKLLTSDWRNHNLLMKLMHAMVNGGEERRRLERAVSDTDEGAALRVALRKMAVERGTPESLLDAIARISK